MCELCAVTRAFDSAVHTVAENVLAAVWMWRNYSHFRGIIHLCVTWLKKFPLDKVQFLDIR